jgi:putative Holliday junction resolvase
VRALGIDLGAKRIGVAISDSAGTVASPFEVVTRSGDRARDHQRLLALAEEMGAECLVIGLPLSLDGSVGPAARLALDEAAELADATTLPVETYDERLTTVTAERSLQEMQVKGAARRKVVDMLAATVLLQSWLDGRTRSEETPRD